MAAKETDIPIACNLAAFTAPQRVHHAELLRRLGAKVLEMRELADGYAYRLAPRPDTVNAAPRAPPSAIPARSRSASRRRRARLHHPEP